MKNIVFVCLGNICRSPMSEFILKDLVQKEGLEDMFCITSASTSGNHDSEDMHPKTKAMLTSHNIDSSPFVSQKLNKNMCENADMIIVMDESNFKNVSNMFPEFASKIKTMISYAPNLGYNEVPDPWFSDNFDETYYILSNACLNLLSELKS